MVIMMEFITHTPRNTYTTIHCTNSFGSENLNPLNPDSIRLGREIENYFIFFILIFSFLLLFVVRKQSEQAKKKDRTVSIGSWNTTPLKKLVFSWFLLSAMTYPHKFNYFERILLGYYQFVRKLCGNCVMIRLLFLRLIFLFLLLFLFLLPTIFVVPSAIFRYQSPAVTFRIGNVWMWWAHFFIFRLTFLFGSIKCKTIQRTM